MDEKFSSGLNFSPAQLYIKAPKRRSGGTTRLASVESAASTDHYDFFMGIELDLLYFFCALFFFVPFLLSLAYKLYLIYLSILFFYLLIRL